MSDVTNDGEDGFIFGGNDSGFKKTGLIRSFDVHRVFDHLNLATD